MLVDPLFVVCIGGLADAMSQLCFVYSVVMTSERACITCGVGENILVGIFVVSHQVVFVPY